MLSLQEIQSVTFEKAVFGGYDARSVEKFLGKVTEDYSALQKENAALKAKMKVLVDKIEEYRSVEEGMRKALLSAQNIADDTVEKAKKERENILQDARNQAETKVDEFHSRIEEEKEKLRSAKTETREFVQHMLKQYSDMALKLQKLAEDEILLTQEQPVAQPEEQEPESEAQSPIPPEKKAEIEAEDAQWKDSISEELNAYMNQKMEEGQSGHEKMPQATARFDFGELKSKGKEK